MQRERKFTHTKIQESEHGPPIGSISVRLKGERNKAEDVVEDFPHQITNVLERVAIAVVIVAS